MIVKIAIGMTIISVILLATYGADVIVSLDGGDGFLPFDHKTRGMGLGGVSLLLAFVAFFISLKSRSKILGILLLIVAALVFLGGIIIVALPFESMSEDVVKMDNLRGAAPLFIAGIILTAMGTVKVVKS